ncbi:MAG: membrane metalloprotease [Nonlabens sp.]|uniref:membrane metalloprotease n=1 Tax=Nonlabens sp. TaxID=1888209 RepID=UPI003219A40E
MSQFKILRAFLFTILLITLSSCSDEEDSRSSNDGAGSNQNDRLTGESANELLSDNQFTNLVIEAVYINGFRPEPSSLTNLINFLSERLNKPGGIRLVERDIPAQTFNTYSIEEVRQIEDANRTEFSMGNTIAVFVLFTDQASENDMNNRVVLGTAYRNTSLVMFQSTIENFSGGINQPSRVNVETSVYNHEFAHIMGLVNLGSTPQSDHEDANNARHCNVAGCLMQAQIEGGNIFDMMGLMGSGVPQLDAQCIADLRANGGR